MFPRGHFSIYGRDLGLDQVCEGRANLAGKEPPDPGRTRRAIDFDLTLYPKRPPRHSLAQFGFAISQAGFYSTLDGNGPAMGPGPRTSYTQTHAAIDHRHGLTGAFGC